MISIVFGVIARIFSNSYLNLFQKVLTAKGQKSSVVNFYTYLGLSVLGLFFLDKINLTQEILFYASSMGLLGTLGNYFIIKALSMGDLSSIAPINSYKPIVAMFVGFLWLHEVPTMQAILGIGLIVLGTYFLLGFAKVEVPHQAIFYRVLALFFSGIEAIFIKKIILLTNVTAAFFLWAFFGLLFALIFLAVSRHKPKIVSLNYQLLLISAVGVMQYSTNYVFSKMNVAYALALFQLSTLLSVFLGASMFNEQNIKAKIVGSLIMIAGAVTIILA